MPSTFKDNDPAPHKPAEPTPQLRHASRGGRMLKACAILLIATMLAACFAPAVAIAEKGGRGNASRAAISQEFADYLKSPGSHRPVTGAPGSPDIGNSAHSTGLIPNPVSLSHLSGKQLGDKISKSRHNSVSSIGGTGSVGGTGSGVVTVGVSSGFPATYDLRQLGKVTAVRNQGSSGSCWAFATYASLESYLLTNETADFSENNLKNAHGFDWGPNDGGNGFISTAYLTRWDGPVSETDDPYNPFSTASPEMSPVKRVQDVYFLPARSNSLDNDNIKAAVMAYGAAYITYLADDSPEYYDPVNASYYMPSYLWWPNHAVAVVGWNDSYSRFNFPTTPPGDGAFIVKNSWGSGWGDEGYFYVSYYDAVMGMDSGEGILVFTADPLQEYDHVYYHDEYGLTENWGFGSDVAWFATEYTANDREYLDAVGFYTAEANSEYMVRVYVDDSLVQTTSGALDLPGYRTVRLNESALLDAGDRLRIEVRLRTPGYIYPIPIEGRVNGYCSAATANVSESFYSSDGVYWYDTVTDAPSGASPYADVCLKAYTSEGNGLFEFSQSSYTAPESGGTATITVTRDTAPAPASVNYSASPGTAAARDFTPVAGTLHFGAGETSKSFEIPVLDDQLLEGSETVALALSGATNESRTGIRSAATLTIADDEMAPAAIPGALGFAASEEDGAVSVIDLANHTVIARLDAGDSPRAVAVSPGGAYLYVADNSSGRLWKLDARSLARLGSIEVGSEPYDIAISPDGSKAAIATRGDNAIAIVDLGSFTVARTVAAGSYPEALAFSSNGSLIYSANRGGSDITIINATTGAASTLGTGAGPSDVAASPDGRVYVACAWSSNLTAVAADGSISDITLEGPATDVVVSPDGYYAYVSLPGRGQVDVLGLWPADPVAQVAVNAPGSLGLSGDGRTLYAAEADSRNIAVISVPDGTVTGTIAAGNDTVSLAIGPAYEAPVFSFNGTEYAVNRSATNLTVSIERQGCLDRPDAVGISVLGGNATAGVDYVTPGTVQFAAGAPEAKLNLTVINGTRGDRTVLLGLTGPQSTSIGPNATAMVTIVNPVVSYTVTLSKGWNLLSVPVTPVDQNITSVIPPAVMADTKIIWVYDNANPRSPWRFYKPTRTVNYISNLTYGTGFWIYVYNGTTLTFTGTIPESQSVPIGTGWNLIGPTSPVTRTPAELYSGYYITWGYENGQWYYYKPSRTVNTLPAIKPGYGYWVKKL